jgi:hypothetical protein
LAAAALRTAMMFSLSGDVRPHGCVFVGVQFNRKVDNTSNLR